MPVSSIVDKRERVGLEFNGHTTAVAKWPPASVPAPITKLTDDLRIKINPDHSVTIVTKTIRITIEVPL